MCGGIVRGENVEGEVYYTNLPLPYRKVLSK